MLPSLLLLALMSIGASLGSPIAPPQQPAKANAKEPINDPLSLEEPVHNGGFGPVDLIRDTVVSTGIMAGMGWLGQKMSKGYENKIQACLAIKNALSPPPKHLDGPMLELFKAERREECRNELQAVKKENPVTKTKPGRSSNKNHFQPSDSLGSPARGPSNGGGEWWSDPVGTAGAIAGKAGALAGSAAAGTYGVYKLLSGGEPGLIPIPIGPR